MCQSCHHRPAPSVAAELIVVDNGSTDDTAAVVTAWMRDRTFPTRLIFEPRPGLSIARNRGVVASTGRLLVFTDDDCELTESYLPDLLRHRAARFVAADTPRLNLPGTRPQLYHRRLAPDF